MLVLGELVLVLVLELELELVLVLAGRILQVGAMLSWERVRRLTAFHCSHPCLMPEVTNTRLCLQP